MKRVLTTAFLICVAILPAQAQRRAGPSGPPNPFWGDAQAASQGEQLYNQNCTLCHGVAGGSGEIGPAILNSNMSAPLRGELNDFQIVEAVRNGVPGTVMSAWAGKLSDDDILKVGAYLHSLRGTAIDNPQPGNVAHGEEVFWGKGQCGSCHMLGGRGAMKGPDLSNIAAERKVPAIVNALTKAQHRLYEDGGAHLRVLPPMDTYDAVHITLKKGKPIDGVLLNQDSYSIQMMGDDNELHLLDRDAIKAIAVKPALMPTDFDKRLTADEFTDLMAFLSRQGRKAPAAASAQGGGNPE